jgi:hypothetical protein
MLRLNEVTICAIDCINPSLAVRAIRESSKSIEFYDSVIFTDTPIRDSEIRAVQIDKIRSKDQYSKFILKEASEFLYSDFILFVQWDGYVLDAKAWNNEFLNYDYIGAKWPWHLDGKNIGNGGFSLRSNKLIKLMAGENFPFIEDMNEDDQIARYYRDRLVSNFGISFASENIADQFSYERSIPDQSTFGFHGLFNFWRHVNDTDVVDIIISLDTTALHSIEFFQLLTSYYQLRKFIPLKSLYCLAKKNCGSDYIIRNFTILYGNEAQAKNMISLFEEL